MFIPVSGVAKYCVGQGGTLYKRTRMKNVLELLVAMPALCKRCQSPFETMIIRWLMVGIICHKRVMLMMGIDCVLIAIDGCQ